MPLVCVTPRQNPLSQQNPFDESVCEYFDLKRLAAPCGVHVRVAVQPTIRGGAAYDRLLATTIAIDVAGSVDRAAFIVTVSAPPTTT